MNDRAQAILDFWFDDLIVEKRFKKDEKFDQLIREKFGEDHNKATSNEYDFKARLIVNDAVYTGYLDQMDEYQRFFMLLPYIHSEEIIDHDRAYKLLTNYLSNHPNFLEIKKFWKDHTAVIKRFHRYPHRNKLLGRRSTAEEIEFLDQPNSSW